MSKKLFNGIQNPIGVYFSSWSSQAQNSASLLDLSQISPPINIIYLSFAQPNCTYVKNQFTFIDTGLQFTSSFSIIQQAIKQRNHCDAFRWWSDIPLHDIQSK